MDAVPLKLIVGLGNPGAEHERQRHNAGFAFVDALSARHGGSFRYEPKHKADLTRVRIAGREVWLAKPMTYMNCSGGPLSARGRFLQNQPR